MPDVDLTQTTATDPNETLTQAGYREEAPPNSSMPQKAVAEFVGTFALIFIGAGSLVGPLVGGTLAAGVYETVLLPRHRAAAGAA